MPNQNGNNVIAGHRDGYNRALKNVEIGKVMGLEGEQTYAISEKLIVDLTDVSVLGNISSTSLTQVTCYPFYLLGHAPSAISSRRNLNTASVYFNLAANGQLLSVY